MLDLGRFRTILMDMDGVIYRSSQLIPGAVDFIRMLRDWEIPFLFLTNNSAPTAEDLPAVEADPTQLQQVVLGMGAPFSVTLALSSVSVSLCTVQPTLVPALTMSEGTLPAGGQAAYDLPARDEPSTTQMHEDEGVEPMPIGPSEFDKNQRRCPIVPALP